LMLALPGSAYLYQGEELGLPEHTSLPDAVRQDPTFMRTGGLELGRDGCRVPMPWTQGARALGFNDTGAAWLPQPPEYGARAFDLQSCLEASTRALYRWLLTLRAERAMGRGARSGVDGLGQDVPGYLATAPDDPRTLVVANPPPGPV